MVEYKPFEDKFYEDVKNITFNDFELTSFGTDKNIGYKLYGKVAWEMWCKPVIESDKKKYCITAVYNDKAIGYIIYGANAEYGRVLNIKLGNIILLAVDKNFQNKKIATGLVNYVVNMFDVNNVDIITVGTDLDNLPAIKTYLKFGFYPVLSWATFRYYPDEELEVPAGFKIELYPEFGEDIFKIISRPNSLMLDSHISENLKGKLKNSIVKNLKEDIKKGRVETLMVYNKSKAALFATFLKEKSLSRIIGRNIYRIIDIIFFTEKKKIRKKLLQALLNYLAVNRDMQVVEFFVELNKWGMIEILEDAGFRIKHNAVTLHRVSADG